ncbi:hypothetical protein GW17_00020039 [Ensete ventricosum]|nr:hypothetical protein GW17_00020039 [Ensete ventricosum]
MYRIARLKPSRLRSSEAEAEAEAQAGEMPSRELLARPNVSSSASAEGNRMAFLNRCGGAHFDQHLDAEL